MKEISELKNWFVREFSDEIVDVLERHNTAAASSAKEEAENPKEPARRSSRRGGRKRSRSGAAKSSDKAAEKATDKAADKATHKVADKA